MVMAFTSLVLAFKAKLSAHDYFDSWNMVVFDGVFGKLMGRRMDHGLLIGNVVTLQKNAYKASVSFFKASRTTWKLQNCSLIIDFIIICSSHRISVPYAPLHLKTIKSFNFF